MAKLTRQNIKIKITREELTRYLNMIKELNKVSSAHRVKWDGKGVLVYSIKGEDGESKSQGKINLLKSFFLKRDSLFKNFPEDVDISYTIIDGKKYHQKFSLLLDEDLDEFEVDIRYISEYNVVETFKTAGNMYKSLTAIAGQDDLIKDLEPETLKERLDPENSDNKFLLSQPMLKQIIKSSKMETENDLMEITIKNGEVVFSESQFELVVANDDSLEDGQWSFKKEYLANIIPHPEYDNITVSIFPSYISINENKSYMLFTLSL